ncbi:Uncharacterized protein GBIM_07404 [Gryllus bimaculatus]|nr:Uncharacterized protein GBIM_07404 [Gryllus bimaculatus]
MFLPCERSTRYVRLTSPPNEHGRLPAAPGEARARCRCKAGHVPWARDGACYRLYTRGPCPEGQFLLDRGTCATLCQRGRLYFPERNICYRVGLRGPCPRGQVVLFESAVRASVDGVSYRGTCGCPDGRGGGARDCSRGAAAAQGPVYCDAKAGMVRWNGTCHALYSRGPCAQNQWLVPEREGRLLWDEAGWRRKQSAARCDCRPGYKAVRAGAGDASGDGDLQCQPPAVSLAKFLNQKYHPDTDRGPDQWW